MREDKKNRLKELAVLQTMCNRDVLFFTRYFFKQRFGQKYIVSPHHRIISAYLNRVLDGTIINLNLNIPPRYGKTELAVKNFIAAGFGLNPGSKFMHLSYSDDLAVDNSDGVRDIIGTVEYMSIYGDFNIKKDSRSKGHWKTTMGGEMYATGFRGQVTGFGAGVLGDEGRNDRRKFNGALVMDDSIKPEDAEFDLIREAVNSRYSSTIKNRVNSPGITPQIYIGHRVHPKDLTAYILATEEYWMSISLPAILDKESLLKEYEYMDDDSNYCKAPLFKIYGYEKIEDCPVEIPLWGRMHSLEMLYKLRANDIVTFGRQYMQNPKPAEGLMYPGEWKTYREIPLEEQIRSQTDTADEGDCYLCSIKYVISNSLRYVLDILYTQEPTEVTEEKCADLNSDVNYAVFESNNGGKSFARNVERICRERGNWKVKVTWYHESTNKDARIKTNASTVQNMVVFPVDWAVRWPKFYDHVTNYMLTGKNRYKDAPDVLTAIVEKEPYGDDWASIT